MISCYKPFGKLSDAVERLSGSMLMHLCCCQNWFCSIGWHSCSICGTSPYILFPLSVIAHMICSVVRTALILGILYLAFQAFPIIFERGHGFNAQMTGLTFLGIGLGMIIGLSTQPYWNRCVNFSAPSAQTPSNAPWP